MDRLNEDILDINETSSGENEVDDAEEIIRSTENVKVLEFQEIGFSVTVQQ